MVLSVAARSRLLAPANRPVSDKANPTKISLRDCAAAVRGVAIRQMSTKLHKRRTHADGVLLNMLCARVKFLGVTGSL